MKKKFGLINIASGGFFSNFFVSLSTAIEANRNNLIPFVELNNTVFSQFSEEIKVNTWNWWFDQDVPSSEDSIIRVTQNIESFLHFPAPFGDDKWNRNNIYDSRLFFNNHFKIKQHILNITDQYYESFFKDKIVLDVMARGTEFNNIHPQYGNQDVYTYVDEVKKVLLENPEIDNVFLVTEDDDYVKIFDNVFDNLLFMNVFRRTTQTLEYCKNNWLWPYENNIRENHTKILGEECLYQALLLGKCDYLVCKRNCMAGAAVFFNDNLKNVYYV